MDTQLLRKLNTPIVTRPLGKLLCTNVQILISLCNQLLESNTCKLRFTRYNVLSTMTIVEEPIIDTLST